MSINEVRYLPECGSTNAYVKEHFEEFGPVAAVYTQNQTAGRGRLGRSWVNAEGKALYYTVAIKEPLAQPATLPLLASLAVRRQLQLRYGVDCQIKWPNDLLLNGKKIVGILCESVSYGYQQQGRGILCGIGINLAQPQSYFDAADLPHGTSLALQGAAVDLATDPAWLAEGLTDFGFDRNLYTFARDGFAPFREEYKAACVNLGRRVTFDLPDGGQGAGDAVDVEERLDHGTLDFDWCTNQVVVNMHHISRRDTYEFDAKAMAHFGGDKKLMYEFVHMMQGDEKILSTMEAGLISTLMCIAARESAKTGTLQPIAWADGKPVARAPR